MKSAKEKPGVKTWLNLISGGCEINFLAQLLVLPTNLSYCAKTPRVQTLKMLQLVINQDQNLLLQTRFEVVRVLVDLKYLRP
ncbi:MAG: hypothetical protein ACRCYY_08190 [Trueperaceae bacterium]